MDSHALRGLQHFKNYVGLKFHLYNSLFTSLPFHRIEKTGILLSMFATDCEEGYAKNESPAEIVSHFFAKHTTYTTAQEKLDILFRFTQFIERQVVLFDALEDAAFTHVHDISGAGTLKHLELEVLEKSKQDALAKKLEDFSVRLVLTAHPTQFYPGPVLAIINDLSRSLAENNAAQVNIYLQQLGKTPFFKKEKPSPYDEAISLVWYLENVFYTAGGRILSFLKNQFPKSVHSGNPVIGMGFWPGGDRDGNPFVNADTTLRVADALRGGIIKCYYLDIRKLKRRLTFKGVDVILTELEKELYANIFIPGERTPLSVDFIITTLSKIRDILLTQHDGLFVHLVNNLINKVYVFGLHFASLDVRQESSVHNTALCEIASFDNTVPADYASFSNDEKATFLMSNPDPLPGQDYTSPLANDTIRSIRAIKLIQQYNGEAGSNRYIISQCNSALNVFEVYGLFILSGWTQDALTIDIVPLFETIDDLQHAADILTELYENEVYNRHLKRRKNRQTIMLGFSDGTKDGGYLMANWGIYKAKEELTAISKKYGIDVVFFDGRGGPPARGGGKTHKFYASMGRNISNREIQLTIQGQTVSSNFGTVDAAQYNIEQLLHAGISNELFDKKPITLKNHEEELLQNLATESFNAYVALKEHPQFLDYLLHVSPLRFYSETNIGSRPAKRSAGKLTLKDLRAIPFVGAWSQLKQNVTGYYGVGTALHKAEATGKFEDIKKLYQNSLFFKTLIDNCEMAMKKCFFPLTQYLSQDKIYGELWNNIFNEYQLTEKYLLLFTGKHELMADYPVEQLSISMRERIVLPLATIQQFAIAAIREIDDGADALKESYEKLVIRCSFGIINAGRNSV